VFFDFAVADRIVMIVSRLLGAAAACVISFFCKWQISKILEWLHEGCDCDLSADFSILALVIFLVKFLLKSVSKSFFFLLWYRGPSGFGATIRIIIMYKKVSLCNSFFCKSLLCVKDSLCVIFFGIKASESINVFYV
jgi:hypothetical protein